MKDMRLRILDQKKHKQIVEEFDYEMSEESNLYATFINITDIQYGELEYNIEKGVYRLCGDDDYEFNDVKTNQRREYKNFEDFYEQHKEEAMSTSDSSKRESKRVHEGIANVIKMLSRKTKCNNNTMITTMLLKYGAYCFYNSVDIDDFDVIRQYHDKYALSAFDHDSYIDGGMALNMLSAPINVFKNSRAVIMDVTRSNRVVHLYPDEYVFKTLEDLAIIGFEGKSSIHGIELLISLAFANSDIINETGMNDKICKLSSPTIKKIKSIIESEWVKV